MPIDPSIAMGLRSTPIDTGASLEKAYTLRNLGLQSQYMQEAHSNMQEDRAVRQQLRRATVLGPNGEIDEPATLRNLSGLVGPADAAKFAHQLTIDRLSVNKDRVDTAEKTRAYIAKRVAALRPDSTLEDVMQASRDISANTGIPQEKFSLPSSQEEVPEFIARARREAQGATSAAANDLAVNKQNFDQSVPQTSLGKLMFDEQKLQQGGGRFGPRPPAPVNAVSPGRPLRNDVITADPDAIANPIEAVARPEFASAIAREAFGTPEPFRYGVNGEVIENEPVSRYQLSKAERGAQRVNVNMPKVEESARIESNKDFREKEYRPSMDQSNVARRNNAQMAAQSTLAIADKTGWGTEAKASAASVLAAAGVKDAEKFAGDAQKFYSIMFQQNYDLLAAAKGIQTEGDAERARKIFLQLGNTPEANAFIRDWATSMNNLTIAKAKFYNQNYDKAMGDGDISRLERDWQGVVDNFKVFDDPAMRKWGAPAAQSETSVQHPATRSAGPSISSAPKGARLTAKNRNTGERIQSTDGGVTWQPLQ